MLPYLPSNTKEEVRHQLVHIKQNGPASNPNKADDVSRPLGAVSETAAGPFPIPYHMKQTFSHITIKLFDLNPIL